MKSGREEERGRDAAQAVRIRYGVCENSPIVKNERDTELPLCHGLCWEGESGD